ncbi:MAG TPA: ferrochelatase [Pyrinomonadaceae bacterium]|nr:ferrochelatase [Pyrinomonadaceae bacterium]
MKRGILLLNFGGPWTLSDVKPFLYRLFVNPSVLVGIPSPFRQLLAFTIAQVKGPSSVRSYRSIGSGSPQLRWTATQAEGLRSLLNRDSIRVEIGMRSAEPTIATAVRRLQYWGAEELVLLPLFPQFSTTTTGTCFKAVELALEELNWHPVVRQITRWPDDPGYIKLLRRTIDEAVTRAEAEANGSQPSIHVLFSAHSLPQKIVRLGDPYPLDVARTVKAVTKDLIRPWSLAFQSRNGRLPWLRPYLEEELKRLGQEGVRNVVVVPLSFVSDHIETLFELDQFYAGVARNHGITSYYRARCFNSDPAFPRVLHSLLLAC